MRIHLDQGRCTAGALGVQGLGFRDEPVEFVSSPFQGVEFRLYMGVHKGTLALRTAPMPSDRCVFLQTVWPLVQDLKKAGCNCSPRLNWQNKDPYTRSPSRPFPLFVVFGSL